jgi:predicted oxidoreductase
MNTIKLGGKLGVPEIALGCMRINALEAKEVDALVKTSMELGVNFFDHADIYGRGACESLFAEAVGMNPSLREKMIIQTKCAIRPGVCFDFSKEYILSSVDASLKRLKTDYIDILLLHRPDMLMEPEEVAEAFSALEASGKVKYFGVSNQYPGQLALLDKYMPGKIIANQLQLSIAHCPMFDSQINVNMMNDGGVMRDGGVVDYCRLNNITIQAWSPFQYGMFAGVFLGSDLYPELNKAIDGLAEKYGVTNSAIAVAWILRHPAKIQTIVGTTNKQRLTDICAASGITLTREEWYELYKAAGKKLP